MRIFYANVSLLLLLGFCSIGLSRQNTDIENIYELTKKDYIRNILLNENIVMQRDVSCDIECPNGGCGSYNISVDFSSVNMTEFNECCDVHDFCYADCYQTQTKCDDAFDVCLVNQCNKWAIEREWTFAQKLDTLNPSGDPVIGWPYNII